MIDSRRDTPLDVRDRRKALRFKLNAPALVNEGPATDAVRKMLVADVSETGLRLEGCIRLDIRRFYPVEFQLPDGDRIRGKARIVWARAEPYVQVYGAEWTGLSWWQRRKLNGGLAHLGGRPAFATFDVHWRDVGTLLAIGAALVFGFCLLFLK